MSGRRTLYLHLPVTRGAGDTQVAARRSGQSKSRTATHAAAANTVLHHKVKRGETLSSIASSYNTTVQALKHDNRNLASLRPGMILIVHNAR